MGPGNEILNLVRMMVRPVAQRVANSIARAVVELVDDTKKMQLLQLTVLAGEVRDDCEHFQGFGFYSVPHVGAEAVVLFPNGDRGRPLVVATDDRRYRPTGGVAGEVGLYNSTTGTRVRLMPSGDVILTPATGQTIQLGGTGQPMIRGTVYRAAEDVLFTAICGALNTLGMGAPNAALATFQAAAATYLSTKVEGGS
jgi:phage baseplate assembly protein V